MKRALIPAVVALALAAILFVQLTHQAGHECTVCVTFEGQRRCATATGPSNGEAKREAQDSACSLMAHGVTKARACPNVQPDEATCKQ